jgi:hypothetical protein
MAYAQGITSLTGLCDPIGPAPDYSYTGICPNNTLPLGDLQEVIAPLVCNETGSTKCGSGQVITKQQNDSFTDLSNGTLLLQLSTKSPVFPCILNSFSTKPSLKKVSTNDDHQRVKFDSSKRKFQKREKLSHLEVEKPVLMGDDYGWGGCAGGRISSSWSDHPGHFPVTGWAHKLLICDKYSSNNSYTAMQSSEHCHQPPLDCIRCDVLAAGLSHCILGHCQQAECRATLPSHYHTPRYSPIQFWPL